MADTPDRPEGQQRDIVERLRSPHTMIQLPSRKRVEHWPNSREREAADEIERLREHVKTLHRLNGFSKQKGWWCSCGEIIQPSWVRYRPDKNSPAPLPWSDEGRGIARALHEKHVGNVIFGGAA